MELRKKVRLWSALILAVVLGYFFSAASVPAFVRMIGATGREFGWFAAPAIRYLEIYQEPAGWACQFRPLHQAFEFAGDLWWHVIDPPDTTP